MSFVADNLRSKDLQHVNEDLKKQEMLLMEERALREAGEQKLHGRVDGLVQAQNELQMMMEKLCSTQSQMEGISEQVPRSKSVLGSGFFASSHTHFHGTTETHTQGSLKNTFHSFPEVDFPLFDGSNPRAWVRKCQRYFKLVNNSLAPENRVALASLHFCGEAKVWLESYMTGKSDDVSWETLVGAVMERFDDNEPYVIVGEFNKLQQRGTVSEYLDKFEELKSHMVLMFSKGLCDEFYVASFVSGLKDEIKGVVMAKRPETLHHAVGWARIQESIVDAIVQRANHSHEHHPPLKPENYAYTPSAGSIRISRTETEPNAMAGNVASGPLRMRGEIENCEVQILIGSGSTHSFLDEEFAKKLQSERRYTTPMIANYVGGGKIVSRVVCPNLKWKIQGNEFIHSVRVMKLGGCDMLLGGDWLRKYSPVGFNFTKRKMTIDKDGKKINLQAITEAGGAYGTSAQLFSIILTPLEEHEN